MLLASKSALYTIGKVDSLLHEEHMGRSLLLFLMVIANPMLSGFEPFTEVINYYLHLTRLPEYFLG